jgi:hypothetical protein
MGYNKSSENEGLPKAGYNSGDLHHADAELSYCCKSSSQTTFDTKQPDQLIVYSKRSHLQLEVCGQSIVNYQGNFFKGQFEGQSSE